MSGRCGSHVARPNGHPFVVRIHARNDDCHAPGTSEAQHIGFLGGRCALDHSAREGACRRAQGDRGHSHVDHGRQLLPKAPHVRAAAAVRVLPIVKDGKAVSQEVGPARGWSWGRG